MPSAMSALSLVMFGPGSGRPEGNKEEDSLSLVMFGPGSGRPEGNKEEDSVGLLFFFFLALCFILEKVRSRSTVEKRTKYCEI